MKRCYSTLKRPLNSNNELIDNIIDFRTCKSTYQARQSHAQLITRGLIQQPIIATKFINLLTSSSIASLSYAQHVFDQIPQPDLFLCNTMIKAYAETPTFAFNCFLLFRSLIRILDLYPNRYSFVYVLKGCGSGLGILEGEQVRVHAIKNGFEGNLFVSNVLIQMYSNWGLVDDARSIFDWSIEQDLYSWNMMIGGYVRWGRLNEAKELFDSMPERDVVSWSTMIAGYVQVCGYKEALDVFHEMLHSGSLPNQYTLVSALAACANLVALDQGRWMHTYIDKNKVKINERLFTSLIDMY
ncbi:Pentatricopeptide repeat, partial [Dillenia turbinata]